MKISETTSYPHPVLAPWSTDIADAAIDTKIIFREDVGTSQVSMHCQVALDHPDITRLINEGSANFGCFIKCQETGLRRLQRMGFPIGKHDFAPGALLGRISVRPVVWTVKSIAGYQPQGAHPEFGGSVDLEAGQILALDDEQYVEVTRPPLPSVESIFEIRSSLEVPEGGFDLDMESHRVIVTMGEKTFELVQALRARDDTTRTVLMNSLYVPIIMRILNELSKGREQYEFYRWLHPFSARCEMASVDMDNPNLFNDAQRLMEYPLWTLERIASDQEEE